MASESKASSKEDEIHLKSTERSRQVVEELGDGPKGGSGEAMAKLAIGERREVAGEDILSADGVGVQDVEEKVEVGMDSKKAKDKDNGNGEKDLGNAGGEDGQSSLIS